MTDQVAVPCVEEQVLVGRRAWRRRCGCGRVHRLERGWEMFRCHSCGRIVCRTPGYSSYKEAEGALVLRTRLWGRSMVGECERRMFFRPRAA